MDTNILTAIISASTSIFVVILSQLLISLKDHKELKAKEIKEIQKEHINPLRFFLAENYLRMKEILAGVKKADRKIVKDILVIQKPSELLEKDLEWCAGYGCYLLSTCYYTACLLALVERIRTKIPFLKLSREDDTRIMELISQIAVDFTKDLNIYYAIQMTIGREIYSEEKQKVLTYREFCVLVKNPENFIWYSSLIQFYLRIAKGEYDNLEVLLKHIKELSDFLDHVVSGGNSIEQRQKCENNE